MLRRISHLLDLLHLRHLGHRLYWLLSLLCENSLVNIEFGCHLSICSKFHDRVRGLHVRHVVVGRDADVARLWKYFEVFGQGVPPVFLIVKIGAMNFGALVSMSTLIDLIVIWM